MEDMIKQILDMEKKAHDIVEAAREKQNHLDEDVESAVQELKQDWTVKMDKKLEMLRAQEAEIAQDKLAQIESNTKAQLKKLERLYQENEKKWVDMLFEDIFTTSS